MRIPWHCQPPLDRSGFVPRHPWPDDCTVQWGGHAPTERSPSLRFFIEVFPAGTYIRAESATSLGEAENRAWARHQRELACPGHEWVPSGDGQKDRKDGVGWCRLCNRFESNVLPVRTICEGCGCIVRLWSPRLCRPCWEGEPDERLTPSERESRTSLRNLERWEAQIRQGEHELFDVEDFER